MRDNIRSKYNWKSDPKDISDGLKSRKLYNETRGTRYEAETKIVRQSEGAPAPSQPEAMSRPMSADSQRKSQSTMGLFNSSSSRVSSRSYGGGGGGSGIFTKLMMEAQSSPSTQAPGTPNPASWMKGASGNMDDGKRGAIERQLKRVAQMESAAKQSHLGAASSAPHLQQAAPAIEQPAVQYVAPLAPPPIQVLVPGPVSIAPSAPLQPMGEIAAALTADMPKPDSDAQTVKSMLAKPENRETFKALRTELGDILLSYKLPDEVADKLRDMAKKLSDLDKETGSQ